MAVSALALTALLLVRRRSFALLQVGLVALALWFTGLVAAGEMRRASEQLPTSHLAAPSWIDAAVPAGATVAVVWRREPSWSEPVVLAREHALWRAELFNRAVGPYYDTGPPMHYGLPESPLPPAGPGTRYVLSASPLRLGGRVIARDRAAHLVLYRLTTTALPSR
jgi:hypothetical protein